MKSEYSLCAYIKCQVELTEISALKKARKQVSVSTGNNEGGICKDENTLDDWKFEESKSGNCAKTSHVQININQTEKNVKRT